MDLQQPAANLSELCRSCEHPLGKAVTIFGAGAEGRGQVLFEQGDISITELLRETRDLLRKILGREKNVNVPWKEKRKSALVAGSYQGLMGELRTLGHPVCQELENQRCISASLEEVQESGPVKLFCSSQP